MFDVELPLIRSPYNVIEMRIPLYQVDAFTTRAFRGNPAAVCLLDRWLDDDLLRAVASENNLSNTAYLVPAAGDYELRWFTPRCEVKLCGHATLASAYIVLNILEPNLAAVRFETRYSGVLTVSREDNFLVTDFPALPPRLCANPPEALLRALGPGTRPITVLEANQVYVAVYESEGEVLSSRPDFAVLEQLHPFAVAVTAPGETADFVSRYFAPSYGVQEDPVTGSAHCVLTPYWTERLDKAHLHARQLSARGGELWCQMAGERVILKGSAVLTLEGTLLV